MGFRVYDRACFVNGIWLTQVWIDTHYEEKHKLSINDEIILGLVRQLHRKEYVPQVKNSDGFEYFKWDGELEKRKYRMIWLIPPCHSYLGVRNAFRRRSKT